ncbi:MFS transporter [Kitasatospora sp. NPDC056138]|uniref:MFS transporter n=1 Tax=Kitasatospora sp. NPDC056138 TaxID=3345724 RepID=UPI0035E0DCFA
MTTSLPDEVPGIRGLFRDRRARLYFPGLLVSLFGDNVLILAAGVWVKSLTGNNGASGLAMFFVLTPTVFAPLFGMLADRVRKRRLMIATNAVMAVVPLLLLFVRTGADVWLIYLVMLAYGVATVTLSSAQSGLFVAMFPEQLLGTATGLITSLQEGMKVLAPAAGAALFVWLGGGTVGVIDALTFAVACGALLLLTVPESAAPPRERELRTEISAGIRHVGAVRELRTVVASAALIMFSVGFITPALFGVVQSDLHRTPAFLGVVVSMQGMGSVVGGLLTTTVLTRLGETRLVGVGAGLTALGTALLAVPTLVTVLLGNGVRGIGLGWMVIGAYTLMQRRTPSHLLGRAAAALNMLIFAPSAVSLLFAAGLSQLVGHRVLLLITPVVTTAVCIHLLTTVSPPPVEEEQ